MFFRIIAMRFNKIIYPILISVFSCSLCGCATQNLHGISVRPVETLEPDSLSQVHVNAVLEVPESALSPRSRLIIRPSLMSGDSIVAGCPLIVLDSKIYAKKNERNEKLYGAIDSLAGYAVTVDARRKISLPYEATLSIPDEFEGGSIEAAVSSVGCGHCSASDGVAVAHVSNIPTLIAPEQSLQLNCIEPEFVIRPKMAKGSGEAVLQFAINSSEMDPMLGNNGKAMEKMLADLEKIISDSLMTLDSVGIYGMASADGPFAFNTCLSVERARSAKQWLVSMLDMPSGQAALIRTGSRPEGWMPVLEAMRADGNGDTLVVAAILDRYGEENDDAAEYFIRRLGCWNDLRDKYLPKDRKVKYVYSYTERQSRDDDALLAMYFKRPDTLNQEELLRVAFLMEDPHDKMDVYRTVLHFFPQSRIAANNLAVLLLNEGKAEEAENVLDPIEQSTPEILNTRAAVYVYRNDYERAAEILASNDTLPQARYNLGLVMARMRHLEEAYRLLKDYGGTDAAIVALSTGRNGEAAEIMAECKDTGPRAEYVRALIEARAGNGGIMIEHLKQAVTDWRLKLRARNEPDFRPFSYEDDFRALINIDEANEQGR